MLCHLCDTFLSNVLHQDFATWKRVNEGWYTFKHGNYSTVTASAQAGCELCVLFNQTRSKRIPSYETLSEKWHIQSASIDVKHDFDSKQGGPETTGLEPHRKWTFLLFTVAPEMSWIPFEIFSPETTGAPHEDDSTKVNWPLAVSLSPTSSTTIDLAKAWIDNCVNCHISCGRPDKAPLPTRVIDVGYSDGTPTPRLQVNEGQLGRYVTLSHCWGIVQRRTLTKRDYHAFQQAIPFQQLPKTFQDAIELTMSLGIRYLWLDALCIIQDDPNDWKRESASMCAVFENALFSISALAASDSHCGFLKERTIRYASAEFDGTTLGVREALNSLPEAMQSSRLDTRAWCLQEQLLPRAILHISLDQMYWQCQACTASESSPDEIPRKLTSHGTMTALNSYPAHENKATTSSQDWLLLVTRYTSRQVTNPSDRLPAIAGLADRIRKEIGNVPYLQGLWANDLHAGISWRRQRFPHGRVIPSRDKYPSRTSANAADPSHRPIASSWSWATINAALEFPTCEEYTERLLSDSDVDFGRYIPEGADVAHRSHGSLQLEGLVKRGSCKPVLQPSSGPDEAAFKPSGSLLVDVGLTCYLDYADNPVSRSCYCLRIATWTKPKLKSTSRKQMEESTRAFYLILERVESESAESDADTDSFGCFKRIGMGYGQPDMVDQIFANAERHQLQLR